MCQFTDHFEEFIVSEGFFLGNCYGVFCCSFISSPFSFSEVQDNVDNEELYENNVMSVIVFHMIAGPLK